MRQPHHQLTEATGGSCRPVAVGAVTGANHEAVGEAIRRAAAEDGEYPTHLTDINFRHQARAVELLGFELFDPSNGNKVEAQSILTTVAHFFHNNNSNDLLLCFAVGLRPGHTKQESHTLAVHRGRFYDNNTNTVVETVHPWLQNFKIIRALAVRCGRAD
jgi:hypothetical protein